MIKYILLFLIFLSSNIFAKNVTNPFVYELTDTPTTRLYNNKWSDYIYSSISEACQAVSNDHPQSSTYTISTSIRDNIVCQVRLIRKSDGVTVSNTSFAVSYTNVSSSCSSRFGETFNFEYYSPPDGSSICHNNCLATQKPNTTKNCVGIIRDGVSNPLCGIDVVVQDKTCKLKPYPESDNPNPTDPSDNSNDSDSGENDCSQAEKDANNGQCPSGDSGDNDCSQAEKDANNGQCPSGDSGDNDCSQAEKDANNGQCPSGDSTKDISNEQCYSVKALCDLRDFFKNEIELQDDPDVSISDPNSSIKKSPNDFDKSYITAPSQCPASPSVNLSLPHQNVSLRFDMTPICNFATDYIRPVLIFLAYIFSAIYIGNAFKG